MSKVLKAVNTAVSDENDDTKRKQGLMPRWDDNDELLDRTCALTLAQMREALDQR